MSEQKVYVGNGTEKTGNFGTFFKLSFSRDDIETLMSNLNEKGYVNIVMNKRRQPSQYGATHSLNIDFWQPSDQSQQQTGQQQFQQGQHPQFQQPVYNPPTHQEQMPQQGFQQQYQQQSPQQAFANEQPMQGNNPQYQQQPNQGSSVVGWQTRDLESPVSYPLN